MGTGCSKISTVVDSGATKKPVNKVEKGKKKISGDDLPSKVLQVDPDEHEIPLNEEERELIMDQWIYAKNDLARIGIKIFISLFDSRPDVKMAFGKFQFLEGISTLAESTLLKVHGMAVIGKIDQIISHLNDTKAVTEYCLDLGRMHLSENINVSVFQAIEEPFISAVSDAMGSEFDGHLEELYRRLIQYVVKMMQLGLTRSKEMQYSV